MRANPGNFDDRAPRRESGRARGRLERVRGAPSGRFADRAALLADQKDDELVVAVIMRTSEEGVATFDTMNNAVLAQKVERPINRDRRRPALSRRTMLRQMLDDFISAKRLVTAEQGFEHSTADRRQSLGASRTLRFRMGDRNAGAALVIVTRRRKNRLRHIRHRSVILVVESASSKFGDTLPWRSESGQPGTF